MRLSMRSRAGATCGVSLSILEIESGRRVPGVGTPTPEVSSVGRALAPPGTEYRPQAPGAAGIHPPETRATPRRASLRVGEGAWRGRRRAGSTGSGAGASRFGTCLEKAL